MRNYYAPRFATACSNRWLNLAAICSARLAKFFAAAGEVGCDACAAKFRSLSSSRMFSRSPEVRKSCSIKNWSIFDNQFIIGARARFCPALCMPPRCINAVDTLDSSTFHASITTPVGLAITVMGSTVGRSSCCNGDSESRWGGASSEVVSAPLVGTVSEAGGSSDRSAAATRRSTPASNSADIPPGRLSLNNAGMRSMRAFLNRKTIQTAAIGQASASTIFEKNSSQSIGAPKLGFFSEMTS